MDALKGFKIIAGLAIFMVTLQVINAATGYSLMAFGLVPRTVHGLLGIVTSPFLHASFSHLSANLVAFLVLGTLVMVDGLNRFMAVKSHHYFAGRLAGLAVRFHYFERTHRRQRLGFRAVGVHSVALTWFQKSWGQCDHGGPRRPVV